MAGEPLHAGGNGAHVVQVITEPIGGSALSVAIQQGRAPAAWQVEAPATAGDWTARVAEVQRTFAGTGWLHDVQEAITATGAARARLERVATEGGVLVTTGQQPGLFGGPVYTWSKALSALAMADEMERVTGVACAPLFWAATDDADLVEAQSVWLSMPGGAVELCGSARAPAGTPAIATPQGDLRTQLAALRAACGSAAETSLLERVEAAYGTPARSIGHAYIDLLQTVLGPLGIPVLDASHPTVRRAGSGLMRTALRCSAVTTAALAERASDIRARGFDPQVDDVPGLTPVFVYEGDVKRRVAVGEAAELAASAAESSLGPNVLLRPIMEATLLPTVAYVAGPGELAYFAQVSALAAALGARVPVALPRWSGTLVEPHMQRTLDRLHVERDALADPHAVDTSLARAAMPADTRDALAALRTQTNTAIDRLAAAGNDTLLPAAVLDGLRRRLAHQLDRLDRRAVAAAKHRETALMRDIATVRGYFFPGGTRQERALTLVPTLVRHGMGVLHLMLDEARKHASARVGRVA